MTPGAAPTARILLLDDHIQFREGLTSLLHAAQRYQVAGGCSTIEEGLEIIAKQPVDLVLLDYDLRGAVSLDFISRARASGFAGHIMLLTAGLPDAQALQALRSGVTGIVFKNEPFAVLENAISQVMSGRAWIDEHYLACLTQASARPSTQLTAREAAVLDGLLEGLTNKEIAGRIGASEAGIKSTLQQLFLKAGLRSRTQLVRWALSRSGLAGGQK